MRRLTVRWDDQGKIWMHRFTIVFVALGTVLAAMVAQPAPPASAQGLLTYCSITIGAGGKTWTYDAYLAPYSPNERVAVADFLSVEKSDFIRETHGPCSFTVFNRKNVDDHGDYVTVGSELKERIRAGLDGIENKDIGGGKTWAIRSIKITAANPACGVRIGGNGVRMTYSTGAYDYVPAMNRLDYIVASSTNPYCRVELHNSPGHKGPRRVYGAPFNAPRTDPGFRARSLKIASAP